MNSFLNDFFVSDDIFIWLAFRRVALRDLSYRIYYIKLSFVSQSVFENVNDLYTNFCCYAFLNGLRQKKYFLGNDNMIVKNSKKKTLKIILCK